MGFVSKPWLGVGLLGWAMVLAGSGAWAQAPAPAVVGVTAARSATLQGKIELSGTVEARLSAVVASLVPGPVVQVAAREGDRVQRGDLLVRVRREDVEQDHAAASARASEAAARLQQAEQSRNRMRELSSSGVISQQVLDDAESEVQVWRGTLTAAKAEIARLDVALRNSRVRAPFSGTVVAKHCELGEWVEAGGAVVELVDLSQLEVLVAVPERHYSAATKGASASVRIDALPGLEVSGQVVAVIPRADPSSRAFPVKIAIDNSSGQIGAGMSAVVELTAVAQHAAILVPKDALLGEGQQRQLFRVEETAEGTVAEAVEVELGSGSGPWIEVFGLTAGDRVITRGNERLMAGMPIELQTVEYPAP